MQPATFARLYDSEKFGMVGVRTVSLSNYDAAPAQRLQRKSGAETPGSEKARSFLGDVERPGLNSEIFGSRRTSGGPVGAASAQGAPTTTVRPSLD